MKGFASVLAVAAAIAGVTVAAPTEIEDRQVYVPCTGLYGSAQCCATDVLGIADLDCGVRKLKTSPRSPPSAHISRAVGRERLASGNRLTSTARQPPRSPRLPTASRPCAPPLASAPAAACCPSWTRASFAAPPLVLTTKGQAVYKPETVLNFSYSLDGSSLEWLWETWSLDHDRE
jgi:hypothetical protein